MLQSDWSQTGNPAPPPPLTFHLDKVIFLKRQRTGIHKSVTTQLVGVCAAPTWERWLLLDVEAPAWGYREQGLWVL